MERNRFTYLLAHPENLTADDAGALETIIKTYPFFQSARALQLKALKSQDSPRYNDALKLTAAHTTDRDILFEYITSKTFIQNEISNNILQHQQATESLPVIIEDVSKSVSEWEKKTYEAEKQKAEAILDPGLFERKEDLDLPAAGTDLAVQTESPTDKKALTFTQDDTYSFSEWLKLASAKPIERKEEPVTLDKKKDSGKEQKFNLIDRFIKTQPKIRPVQTESKETSIEISKQISSYSQAPDALMTETLARVYFEQKNYKKAIQAYKILILKNPEKSGYFADQIRAIEKTINPEQS